MDEHKYTIEEMKQMLARLFVLQEESRKEFQETKNFLTEKFKETDKQFKETDRFLNEKFLKTDIKFQQSEQQLTRTEKYLKEVTRQLGGLGNSNGAVAEEFFFNGFDATMRVGEIKYDYIDKNIYRKTKNLEGEYDIVLINSKKLLIIEVKYKLKKEHIREFYQNKLPKFKKLFPEYKDYTIHGAMAALSFESGAKKAVIKRGLLLFTQSGDNIKNISPENLELSKF